MCLKLNYLDEGDVKEPRIYCKYKNRYF